MSQLLKSIKNILFKVAIVSLLYIPITFAQFSPVGQGFNHNVRTLYADTLTGLVYAGGNFTKLYTGEDMYHISVWDGIAWDSLDGGCPDGGVVFGISALGTDIFVGGSINIFGANNYRGLAKWTSGNWQSIGDVISSDGYGGIRSIKNHNQELYVVGHLASANGLPADKIAKWDGTSWSYFPPIDSLGYALLTSEFYNNELYVGGQLDGPSSANRHDLAKFDGTNWLPVGNGLSGQGYVKDMIVYQNDLYIAGSFQTINGDPGNGIAKWNGVSWDSLEGGTNGFIDDLEIFNGELYIGGNFSSAGGVAVDYIAKWDGNQWHNIGGEFNSIVTSLAVLNNELYIGGNFWILNGVPTYRIAKYSPLVNVNEVENIKFEIFPNHSTSNFITIKYSLEQNTPGLIKIFDTKGKVVYTYPLPPWSSYQNLSIPNLTSGIYMLRLESGRRSSGLKFVRY